MSHFDDLWPAIKDGLAALGFMTLCAFFCFFFLMAKDAWHDKREQARAKQKSLKALKANWSKKPVEAR